MVASDLEMDLVTTDAGTHYDSIGFTPQSAERLALSDMRIDWGEYAPTRERMYDLSFETEVTWPITIETDEFTGTDEPVMRLLNTITYAVQHIRLFSRGIHSITRGLAEHMAKRRHNTHSQAIEDLPHTPSCVSRRWELEEAPGWYEWDCTLQDRLRAIEVSTMALADVAPSKYGQRPMDVYEWLTDVRAAIENACDAFDEATGYEHHHSKDHVSIEYVDLNDEGRLADLWTQYEDAVYGLDFERVIDDCYSKADRIELQGAMA